MLCGTSYASAADLAPIGDEARASRSTPAQNAPLPVRMMAWQRGSALARLSASASAIMVDESRAFFRCGRSMVTVT
jgi:hypothetical protein